MQDDAPRPPEIALARSLTADDATADRMAAALYRVGARRPQFWLRYILFAGCLLVLYLVGYLPLVVAVASTLGLVALSGWLRLRNLRRQFRVLVPPGTVLAVGFGPDAMSIQGAESIGQVKYSAFRRAVLSGDFVVLERRTRVLFTVLPRSLFTEEDIATIRAGSRP